MSSPAPAPDRLQPLVLLGVPGFVAAVALVALVLFSRAQPAVEHPGAQEPPAVGGATADGQPAVGSVVVEEPPAVGGGVPQEPVTVADRGPTDTPWHTASPLAAPDRSSEPSADSAAASPARTASARVSQPDTGGTTAAYVSPPASGEPLTADVPATSVTAPEVEDATALPRAGVLTQPAWRLFTESRHGYSLELPATWREVGAGTVDVTFGVTHTSALFVDPETEARLMVTVWDDSPLPGVRDWPTALEPNLVSVNGRRPVNGMVAGCPALVAWSERSPAGRPAYAAFFRRGDAYYRIHFLIGREATSLGAFHRALATLQWNGTTGRTMIPPLPRAPSSP